MSRFATVGAVRRAVWILCLSLAASSVACDRRIEPFDPDETVHEPDLSKIFPEGAERAEELAPGLPPAPGEQRGAPPLAAELASAPGPGSDAPPLSGRVEVAPELAARVPANAVLFIIARRGGGGPPLAVERIVGPSLPLAFEIGPEDRMIQAMPFEGPLTLSARLDTDGNASSSTPGDLSGSARGGPFEPGASDIVIVLDTAL